MGEHQFRPLFGFFSALTMPIYVYASDADFKGLVLQNEAILARISQAAEEMCSFLAADLRRGLHGLDSKSNAVGVRTTASN